MNPATPVAALSLADCAASCGLGRSKFYQLVKQGRGPRAVQIDRRLIVLVEDRDAWLRALASHAAA